MLIYKEFLSKRHCQTQAESLWQHTVTRPNMFRLAVQPPLFFHSKL